MPKQPAATATHAASHRQQTTVHMPAPVSPPPPPPPPPPPQHREAEGSPPDLYDVAVQRICDHLRHTGQHGDDLDPPTFAERLARHLRRLRSRYLFSYLDGGISAEDVLLHMRILDDCADPDKRPVFHARFVGARLYGVPVVVDGGDDRQDLLHEPGIVFRHEIVFSSVERPRVLSRLTALVSEVGLNILGAGIYNTVDGFCLFVFLVDGWESKDAGDLIAKLEDTALRRASPSHSTNPSTYV